MTTNTKEKSVAYQDLHVSTQDREAACLLKSTLEVAPVWLKKNARIEALMFPEFVAQMIAALIERALRKK